MPANALKILAARRAAAESAADEAVALGLPAADVEAELARQGFADVAAAAVVAAVERRAHMAAQFPKVCQCCGASYPVEAWRELPLLGHTEDDVARLEYRNCTGNGGTCQDTLVVTVPRTGRQETPFTVDEPGAPGGACPVCTHHQESHLSMSYQPILCAECKKLGKRCDWAKRWRRKRGPR